jgi:hypothetical protein
MTKHAAGKVALTLALVAALALAGLSLRATLALFTDTASVPANTFTTAASFGCTAGDTGFLNPTAQAADTGGDGNGFEVNPTYAFLDGISNASNYDGAGDRHRYYNYGVSIPSACDITGIEVRLDWWLDSTFGTNSMSVELSWDGGASWSVFKTDTQATTSEHTAVLGGSTDTWGRSWTPSDLSDGNLRVRVTSNSDSGFRDFFLDWVPIKVYYGPPSVSILGAWTTGLSHTVGSGNNRLLVFIAGMENGMAGASPPAGDRDLTAVTYGGQPLTPAEEVVLCSGSPDSFCIRTELWYLDDAGIQAATGSTFSPTWSGDPPYELEEYYTAVTLENVDQNSPIGDSSTNSTTTANPIQTSSTLAVEGRDLVLVSAAAGNAGSYTPGSGYTEGTDQSALSSTMASAYKAIAADGTEQPSMQFDLTVNRQVILAAVVKAAP